MPPQIVAPGRRSPGRKFYKPTPSGPAVGQDPPNLVVAIVPGANYPSASLTWDASLTPGVTEFDIYHRSPSTSAIFNPAVDTPLATQQGSPYVYSLGTTADGTHDWQVFGRIPTAPPFVPSSYPGYYEEFDFSITANITQSSGAVSQVNGLNGQNVTQSNGALQPITGTRTIGGLNCLDFTPGNVLFLDIADQAQPLTIYAVVQSDDTGTSNRQPVANSTSANQPVVYMTSSQWHYFAGSDVASAISVDTNAHVIGAVFNGASSKGFVDTSTYTGDPSTSPLISFSIGADAGGSFGFDGRIGHVIYYTAAHNDTDRAAITAGLKAKWSTV